MIIKEFKYMNILYFIEVGVLNRDLTLPISPSPYLPISLSPHPPISPPSHPRSETRTTEPVAIASKI